MRAPQPDAEIHPGNILMHLHKMLGLTLFCFAGLQLSAAQKVAIIASRELPSPARHGVTVLEEALRARGFTVVSGRQDADYLVFVGGETAVTAAHNLKGSAFEFQKAPEALDVLRGRIDGKPAIVLAGADSRGLMYAGLDTAEKISASAGGDPFSEVRETSESPFLEQRGVSTYTMHRAYFEQRLYDERYWTRYFDMLAASRINNFVLIFGYENGGFMAPPYPYFFKTPGFPGVEMVGITAKQQAKNTAALKTMIRVAHERGVDVTAAIWDHIYRGGVQGGGIPGASEKAGKRIPGLVFGVNADNLAAYTKASLRRFLEMFPEIDAIQFRLHGESGLEEGEMQSFWHDVFVSLKQQSPNLRLDLRAKDLPDAVIEDALSLGLKTRVSTKYWMEQMGLPFHPTHINKQNQRDRRHGYADLLRYPQRYRVHWQLWSGGTTRLLLWGDPEYVRRFAQSARLYDGNSFEVNEMLATKMLAEAHDAKPVEVLNPDYRYYDYEFERYWHFYQVWGRLTYNLQADPRIWTRAFDTRFGPEAGRHVMEGLHLASKVLPRIVAASYRYENFPTTRGWAEMNRQGSLPEYAEQEGSDIEQFMNVRDEAATLIAGADTSKRRPEETSRWFQVTSDAILDHVRLAEKSIRNPSNKEFRSAVTDLKILAGLARFHSRRLLAGVRYNLYKQTGNLAEFDEAIATERDALQSWKQIVEAAADVYNHQLPFGPHAKGFSRHWEEEYSLLSRDFELLLAERKKASGKKGIPQALFAPTPPPVVRLEAASQAEPGQEFLVSAQVNASQGLKRIQLRYRHLTQWEDYETVAMSRDPKSGSYVGRIPGSFVQSQWDLMYFVEVVDQNGMGRIYPDLEVEAPYVVVRVRR
jgi:hypothetical protein